jgi:hypothetical protein
MHGLLAGYLTNDQFDDWLAAHDFDVFRNPGDYHDAVLGPIVERSWCLYNDTHEADSQARKPDLP